MPLSAFNKNISCKLCKDTNSCLKQKNLITLFPGNFGRPNPQLSGGRSRALSIVLLQARNPQSPGQEVSGPPAA